MKVKASFFLIFFLLASVSYAGSVRLLNDSPYKLRAVIRGNDGTFLGEMVINPQHITQWNDSYGQIGQFGKGNAYQEQSTRSQTPYTVLWYCMDGSDYSVCNTVATGGAVTAQTCDGARQCKPPKKQQPPGVPYPNQPEGNFLHQADEELQSEAGPPGTGLD